MPAIILPGKYRQPPTGPVELDRHHPFAEGLLIYVLPAGGTQLIDYANRTGKKSIPLSLGTGGISAANGFAGLAIKGSNGGGTAVYDWGENPYPWNEPTRAVTVFAYSERIGNALSNAPLIGCFRGSSAQYNLYDANGTGELRFVTSVGGWTEASGGAGSYVTGKAHLYVGRYDGAALTVWRDNVKLGTTALTGNLPTDAANRGAIFNFAAEELSRTPNALLFAGGVYNRALSDAEIAQLADNPFQLIRPVSGRIYFFPSAGGGGATLTADSGTYTLTGTAVTLKADRKLAADSGSYAITGTDVSLKVGRKLSADSGTYSVTGTAVNFLRGYALAAESGSYSVSGTDAALRVGRLLSAASGSYVLSGSAAALQYQPAGSYSLTAESGAYTLTGTAATLKASRKLTADSGTYALTGTDVTLTRGFKITADSGTYTLTGSNVSFARTYVLGADSGSYTLTGSDVGLTWSAAPVVETPTHGGPSIYGKAVFREKEFKREYEREVFRIENERIRAIQMREDEEIVIIMAALAA